MRPFSGRSTVVSSTCASSKAPAGVDPKQQWSYEKDGTLRAYNGKAGNVGVVQQCLTAELQQAPGNEGNQGQYDVFAVDLHTGGIAVVLFNRSPVR